MAQDDTEDTEDTEAPGGPAAAGPAEITDRRAVRLAIGALALGLLLAALDQTIVSTALPTIVSDLGGLDHLSWVVTAYLLASTAATPCGASSVTCTAGRSSSRPSS